MINVSLIDLLRQSDFVKLNMSLTSETHHTNGREKPAIVKLAYILVNAARGGTLARLVGAIPCSPVQLMGHCRNLAGAAPLSR